MRNALSIGDVYSIGFVAADPRGLSPVPAVGVHDGASLAGNESADAS